MRGDRRERDRKKQEAKPKPAKRKASTDAEAKPTKRGKRSKTDPEAEPSLEEHAPTTPPSRRAQKSKGQQALPKQPAKGSGAQRPHGEGKGKQAQRKQQPAKESSKEGKTVGSQQGSVKINRAPVLTLWVAVVAQKQGYSWEEALTFGRYVSGLLAHSKGKSLGMYEDHEKTEEEKEARRQHDEEMGVEKVEVFGMKVAAVEEGGERRAVSGGKPIQPGSIQGYLQHSFGDALQPAQEAMEALAAAIPAGQLGKVCYKLYEHFRPAWKGWGQKGELSLTGIRGLADSWDSVV
ncbi:hypothetical protein N2152v2_008167 [Parachlorella kessleri]